jgi:hypothetical protein
MTISTINELETALNAQFSKYYSAKTDTLPTASQAVVGGFHSFWRATGVPAQAAVPANTTAAVLNNTTLGAISFMQQTSPKQSYLATLAASSSASGTTLEIHDRLAHCAGLTADGPNTFTINGFDFSTLTTSNLTNRIGDANYSDIQWWLEWYTGQTGGDAANATINVTYNDGTTGTLSVVAIGGTIRASRMIPLNSLIVAADSGKYIRAVNSVQVGDTNATSNFGITATRYRAAIRMPVLNKVYSNIWAETGLPEIYNESCLFPVCIATSANMGNIRIDGNIVHG